MSRPPIIAAGSVRADRPVVLHAQSEYPSVEGWTLCGRTLSRPEERPGANVTCRGCLRAREQERRP